MQSRRVWTRAFPQVRILSDVNRLSFDDPLAKELKTLPVTTEEIVSCCDDLKLLGKLDFKNLLKWRTAVLRDARFAKPKVSPRNFAQNVVHNP